MVKTNYMVALSNFHYVIIRPHLEKTSVILCINVIFMITNGMNLLMKIFNKIGSYVLSCLDEDMQLMRELCESRDSCDDLMFDRSELHIFIETLCTI